jgi:hypothetical protein
VKSASEANLPEPFAESPPSATRRGRVRAPRNLAAGASLVLVAVIALGAGANLDLGRLSSMGPGMLPRGVAVLVGLFGALMIASAFLKDGEPIGRLRVRGPLFVSLAIVAFALTIRTVGLAVAGPLVVIIGGAASEEVRVRELVIFGLLLTAACVALFRYALGLPIPVLIVPGVTRI